MLPTHFAPTNPLSSSDDAHTPSMSHPPPSHRHGQTTYPPATQPMRPSSIARSQPSSPLVRRIFGPRGIAALTIDTGPLSKASVAPSALPYQPKGLKRGRWHTLEFKLYYLILLFAIPLMVYIPVTLSQPSNRNYYSYSNHLRQGWIMGRMRDDSDFQYRSFRDYVPALVAIMLGYLGLSRLFATLPLRSSSYTGITSVTQKPNRISFLIVSTSIFVFALHGTNSLKLLLVCSLNYLLAKIVAGTRIAPAAAFAFNISALFAIHWNDGFEYHKLSHHLEPLEFFTGLLPRWQINFNITMLRLVSFSFDLHWARTDSRNKTRLRTPADEAEGVEPTYQERTRQSRHLDEYSYLNYLIYVLYPPLFIAGPIMMFNDFISQLHRPMKLPVRSVLTYGARFLFSLFTMELILHYVYVNAIKDAKAWTGATPLELSMIGFWNLIIVWLKLLLPWRFFRLWALADGVDPPENMIRCMANNYSTLGFWRSWHRSYNLWIVRYIYVPLGGAKNQIPATLLVFTFVALWHDLSLKLLTWGWLITFFLVPEIVARKMVPASKHGDTWWYRHVAAVGGVGNVLMMMAGNLVGFAIGTDGMRYMAEQLLGSWEGVRFMATACAVLFIGVQVMFEYREEELRRGIDRKC